MIKKFLPGVVALALTPAAHAVVIGGAVTDIAGMGAGADAFDQGGVFTQLPLPFYPPNGAPDTVGNDTFQTPNLYAFNEIQNYTLSAGESYDVNQGSDLVAGMTVSSHYVFFDPASPTSQEGHVDFDSDIIGLITGRTNLIASDAFVNTNVTYLSPSARGLESGDLVSFSGSRLFVDWKASTPGDFIRVITGSSAGGQDPCSTNPPGVGGCPAAVPEPTPLPLALLGLLAGITSLRLRRAPGSSRG